MKFVAVLVFSCVATLVPIGEARTVESIDARAIRALPECVRSDVLLIQKIRLARQSGDASYQDSVNGLRKCVDESLPKAIAAAGKHDDLRNAVKEYYVKATTYVDSIGTRRQPEADADDAQAWNRVSMELKLLGAD